MREDEGTSKQLVEDFTPQMLQNWRNDPRLADAPKYRELMEPTVELLLPILGGKNTSRDDLTDERMSFRSLALISSAYFRIITHREYLLKLRATFGDERFTYTDGSEVRETGLKVSDMIHTEWVLQEARARAQVGTASTGVREVDLIRLHFEISAEQRARFANGTLTIGDYVLESPASLTLPHPQLRVPHRHFAWKR